MRLLCNKNEAGYTVISDDGVVAHKASRQQAIDAIRERYPDAPDEIEQLLDREPTPGEWRTLHSLAIFAEMRSINNDLGRRDVAAETINARLAICESMQRDLGDELVEVSRQQRRQELDLAQRAFDDALVKMVTGMWRGMDECDTFEQAVELYGLGCKQNLNDTPIGERLRRAKRRCP